jgi:sugar lactone lactonase YvrE
MNCNKALPQVLSTAAIFFAFASLLACGSNRATTIVANPTLAIADTGNNRILVYNTPIDTLGSPAVVLGQTDFSNGGANRGSGTPAANTFNIPGSVAKDSAGNLYVADSGNARVLIFRPPFSTGMKASVVIGQHGFTSANVSNTATGMGSSYSVAIDSKGNLWVGDDTNDRVMEYTPPFSNGMAATLVLGQSSTDGAKVCYETSPTPTNLCSPNGMSFDAQGNLWLADADFNRILEFTPPFSTGMAATLELGQPGPAFNLDYTPIASAISLAAPFDLKFDSNGNLWVADFGHNRVLEYLPPFTNGMAATSVLGQVDFTHGDPNQGGDSPAAGTISGPTSLAFSSDGKLSVIDNGNSRVLFFAPPFSQGMNATVLVGQTDFTRGSQNQGTGSPTANSLAGPLSLSSF